jgi:hypothetical protein
LRETLAAIRDLTFAIGQLHDHEAQRETCAKLTEDIRGLTGKLAGHFSEHVVQALGDHEVVEPDHYLDPPSARA